MFLRWGVTPKLEDHPNVGCPRLLIQYIRSYSPYWRPFLHPQPEDAPCRGDRDPHTRICCVHLWKLILINNCMHKYCKCAGVFLDQNYYRSTNYTQDIYMAFLPYECVCIVSEPLYKKFQLQNSHLHDFSPLWIWRCEVYLGQIWESQTTNITFISFCFWMNILVDYKVSSLWVRPSTKGISVLLILG
jgi:hypothetical protein